MAIVGLMSGCRPAKHFVRSLIPPGLLMLAVAGCGGSNQPPDAPLISIEEERAAAEAARGPRLLHRAEVLRAIDRGMGAFLQYVFVEPYLVEGAFQGFRVVELRPRGAWEGIDLRPGDVVTRVNGQVIERPEQAHAVFVGLKEAEQIVVSLVRDGEPQELVVPIVDDEAPSTDGAVGPTPTPKDL